MDDNLQLKNESEPQQKFLSLSELASILGCSISAIKRSVSIGLLPKLQDGQLFNANELRDKLGAADLNEPFIHADEAAQFLSISVNALIYLCHSGKLPHYQLHHIHGSRLLFRQSDLEKYKRVILEYHPIIRDWESTNSFLHKFLNKALEMSWQLTDVQKEVFKNYYLEGKSLKEISNKLDFTHERVRQIKETTKERLLYIFDVNNMVTYTELQELNERLLETLGQVADFIREFVVGFEEQTGSNTISQKRILEKLLQLLEQAANNLPASHRTLKEYLLEQSSQVSIADREAARIKKILATPITEINLSNRSQNVLLNKNISTMGDLASTDIFELQYMRNLGKKSVEEIIDKVHYFGLKFRNE